MFDFSNNNEEDGKRQFGERLEKARKKKDMTQERLAELLEVSRTTVTAWETGTKIPHYSKFSKICNLLNIDLGYLFGDYTERNYSYKELSKKTHLSEKALDELLNINPLNLDILNLLLIDDSHAFTNLLDLFTQYYTVKHFKNTPVPPDKLNERKRELSELSANTNRIIIDINEQIGHIKEYLATH